MAEAALVVMMAVVVVMVKVELEGVLTVRWVEAVMAMVPMLQQG